MRLVNILSMISVSQNNNIFLILGKKIKGNCSKPVNSYLRVKGFTGMGMLLGSKEFIK